MNDFLSRLIARSAGEKPAVRPRIAPAFAQPPVTDQRSAARDVMQEVSQSLPAVSPLPFETARRVERPEGDYVRTGHSESLKTGSIPSVNQDSARRSAPESKRSLQEIPAAVTDRAVTTQETIVTRSIPERAIQRQDHARVAAEAGEAPTAQTPPAIIFEATRASRESREEPPTTAIVKTVASDPPAVPRPLAAARNCDSLSDAPKKREAREPVIQVTIGKIEVRASIASPKSRDKKLPTGAMSLEEYQRLRNRRSAG